MAAAGQGAKADGGDHMRVVSRRVFPGVSQDHCASPSAQPQARARTSDAASQAWKPSGREAGAPLASNGPGIPLIRPPVTPQAVRCRPLSADERAAGETECVTLSRDGAVEITESGTQSLEAGASYAPTRRFKFDYVFGAHATQAQVHSALGREALKGFWDGFPTAVVSVGPLAVEPAGAVGGNVPALSRAIKWAPLPPRPSPSAFGSQLAYGPTGSGKTHTILGPPNAAAADDEGASLGLLPRMLQDILNRLRKEARKLGHSIPNSEAGDVIVPDEALALARGLLPPATPVADRAAALLDAWPAYGVARVRVSYVELYAERVFDLLAPAREDAPGAAGGSTPTTPLKGRGARLRVRENKDGSTFVDGATTVAVRSWQDVEALLAKGEARRAVAATRANASSSRSHAVFTLTVVRRDVKALLAGVPASDAAGPQAGRVRHPMVNCKLVVVDLAGSESAKATDPLSSGAGGARAGASSASTPSRARPRPVPGSVQDRAHEARNINTSLTALGKVVLQLAARDCGGRALRRGSAGATSTATPSRRAESAAAAGSTATTGEPFVNYRDSLLTWILKDCLSRGSKTIVLANVSPAASALPHAAAALRFVERARGIAVHARSRREVVIGRPPTPPPASPPPPQRRSPTPPPTPPRPESPPVSPPPQDSDGLQLPPSVAAARRLSPRGPEGRAADGGFAPFSPPGSHAKPSARLGHSEAGQDDEDAGLVVAAHPPPDRSRGPGEGKFGGSRGGGEEDSARYEAMPTRYGLAEAARVHSELRDAHAAAADASERAGRAEAKCLELQRRLEEWKRRAHDEACRAERAERSLAEALRQMEEAKLENEELCSAMALLVRNRPEGSLQSPGRGGGAVGHAESQASAGGHALDGCGPAELASPRAASGRHASEAISPTASTRELHDSARARADGDSEASQTGSPSSSSSGTDGPVVLSGASPHDTAWGGASSAPAGAIEDGPRTPAGVAAGSSKASAGEAGAAAAGVLPQSSPGRVRVQHAAAPDASSAVQTPNGLLGQGGGCNLEAGTPGGPDRGPRQRTARKPPPPKGPKPSWVRKEPAQESELPLLPSSPTPPPQPVPACAVPQPRQQEPGSRAQPLQMTRTPQGIVPRPSRGAAPLPISLTPQGSGSNGTTLLPRTDSTRAASASPFVSRGAATALQRASSFQLPVLDSMWPVNASPESLTGRIASSLSASAARHAGAKQSSPAVSDGLV